MADEPAPHASGMGIAPELLVRELIAIGLHELAGDEVRLREVVARVDAELQLGSTSRWADDLVVAYRHLLDSASPDYLQLRMGWPVDNAHLPCVSIIKEASSEDQGGAVVGDILDYKVRQEGTYTYLQPDGVTVAEAPRTVEHVLIGTAYSSTVQIGSWTTSPELSILLDAAVWNVLFRDKGRLLVAGVTDVAFSEGGMPTDPTTQLDLRVGYVPLQRVTLDWIRGQTRRRPIPNRIRFLPGIFS